MKSTYDYTNMTLSDRDVSNDILREAELPILDRSTCAKDYGRSLFTENMMCAGFQQGGVDTCQVGLMLVILCLYCGFMKYFMVIIWW